MVYYAIVSVIPLLLLLLAGLGIALRFSAVAAETERQVLLLIETNFGPQLADSLNHLLATLQQESIIATFVSLAGLVWTASALFKHLRLGFRAIWKVDPPLVAGPLRIVVLTTLMEQLISLIMVIGGGGLLVMAFSVVAATQWLNQLVGSESLFGKATGWVLTAMSSFVVAAIIFAALLKFLPPVTIRWRDTWLAASLCAIAWVMASEFLTIYGGTVGGSAVG